MALEDIFRFVSSEERKIKEAEFQRKIFPLGLSQREAALKALRPLINPKVGDTDILYAAISTKEKYLNNPEHPQTSMQNYVNGMRHFSAAEKEYLMAFVPLDINAGSLEEYPTADDIARAVESAGSRQTENQKSPEE